MTANRDNNHCADIVTIGNFANSYSSVPPPSNKMGFVEMTSDGVVGL